MAETIKLSETSALVLLWLQDRVYRSEQVRDYLSRLDLSAGQELLDKCDAIWPHYAEVIVNRKHTILTHIKAALAETPSLQIISGAAGLDPLGLELTQLHEGLEVFEIDREQMDVKAELIRNPALRHIAGDLGDMPAIARKLTEAGWQTERPTLLVLEGISYYVPSAVLKNVTQVLKPQKTVVCHLRETGMNDEANAVSSEVFDVIKSYVSLSEIRRYDSASLAKLLDMEISGHWSLCAMERQRTGRNVYFPSDEFGWLDVTALERPD